MVSLLSSVLITLAINVRENREVAIIDIPNFHVQTPNKGDRVIMQTTGELAISLVQVCPESHKEHLTKEKGTPVLHVQADRAIHGMLHSGMSSHKKLAKFSQDNDFIIDPHDHVWPTRPCVANN